jgi:glycosyltransferase involved in cell wall biosynthesis
MIQIPNVTRVIVTGPSRTAVGGGPMHINLLMRSTVAREFDLHYVEVGSRGQESPASDESAFAMVRRLVWTPLALAGAILRRRADIVHINTSMVRKSFWRDLVYFAIAKALRTKVIYQVHGGSPDNFRTTNGRYRRALTWAFRNADAVVVLCSKEYHEYKQFVPLDRLVMIPNSIDLAEYAAARPRGYAGTPVRLGYLGRLDAEKGLLEAIEAVRLLVYERNFDAISLVLGGSGPLHGELARRITALHLERHVRLIGPVRGEAKAQFWRDTEVLIFPSYHEGLPYTVLESLASATPVIGTSVGGVPDAVTDGVHGILVPPRNARAVADAIATLIPDRTRLRAMSVACLARAQHYYGIDRLGREVGDLYRAVLGDVVPLRGSNVSDPMMIQAARSVRTILRSE